jgi:hypothetical protein
MDRRVTAASPAGAVLVFLTGRLPIDAGISVEGDVGLVRHGPDNIAHVSD